MKKIDTGYQFIHFYDSFMSQDDCSFVKDFVLNKIKNKDNDTSKMPWHTSDTINVYELDKNSEIINVITKNRKVLTEIVSECYKEKVYPHFTDLVLWNTGRKMETHIDDGDMHEEGTELNKHFAPRHYSSVIYINDDYEGGNTYVFDDETDNFYESNPKTGAVLIFTADKKCPHGVSEVEKGIRITLPTWFTRDIRFKDNLD